MNKKIKSTIISTIILLTFITTTVFVQADSCPHAVKGTAYIDGSIAGPGIEIEIEFYQDETYIGSETATTFTYDGSYNFNIGFEGHEGEKGYFRIDDQAPDNLPEPYVEINYEDTYYYVGQLNFSLSGDDLIPPSKVTGLSVTDAKDGKLDLSWDAATDNVAVAYYNIYRDDILIDIEISNTYQDTGLNNEQLYCYNVSAVDTSDNEGEQSDQNCATPTETTTPNNPPDTPINPKPENNSENIGINPELSVFVTDPDGDNMNVSFYNENDELIGVVNNAQNATNASLYWGDLEYNTSYSWYAVANDSEFETHSDNFTFKTINQEEDNIKPNIFFEKPENGSLYIFDSMIFSAILKTPFVLGKLNIAINATDNETGISRVELSIIGNYQNITENLTQYPYTYEWNKFGFGLYNITATAYDMNQNSATTNIIVRKFL